MGEQHSPAVGGIATPGRNAGNGGDQGGFKGILQQNGPVKFFPAKVPGQEELSRQSPVASLLVIGENTINMRTGRKHITYPGQGQQGDLGIREIFTYGPDCRGGHNRIADPVGGTDKEPLRFFGKVVHFSYFSYFAAL